MTGLQEGGARGDGDAGAAIAIGGQATGGLRSLPFARDVQGTGVTAEPADSMGGILPDWLARRADVSRNRLALVAPGTRWTFADLDAAAEQAAGWLAGRGIGPNDRVATLLRNGAWPVVVLHGLIRLGAVLVPLNTRLTIPELVWQLTNCGARFLIADEPNAEKATTAASTVSGVAGIFVPPLAAGSSGGLEVRAQARAEPRQVDLQALHSIVYTSGTTGRPKGAMLTLGNHCWNAIGSALYLGLRPDDRLLASLPLFHVGGMAILFRSVIYGAAAVVQETFDPHAMNAAIDDEGVTIVSVVAAMLQRMLDDRGSRSYPLSLRCVLLGGGPAPRPLLEDCERRGMPVVQTYGLTETASQAVTLAPEDALRKLGSAGTPLLPLELRISVNGRTAATGEVGEILVKGPSVSPGYWGMGGSNRDAEDWLHTGDAGWLDTEGYLYVADRRDDLIVSGGENVYPAEVEAALLAHPAVEEAGVVGVPDPRWGQVPVAVVKLRAGARSSEEDLIQFCANRLARYKAPSRVGFLPSLPRNAAGKLLRRELRDSELVRGWVGSNTS